MKRYIKMPMGKLRGSLDAYFFLLLILFVLSLPYLLAHSQSSVWTLARGVDELEFFRNIDRLLYATWGDYRYLDAVVGFAYGGSYWLLSAALAFPFWRAGEDQLVVIVLRLVSLLSALGAFYVVSRILKRFQVPVWLGCCAIAGCFLSFIHIATATVIHPETLYALGLMLAFACLVRDEGRLGRWLTFSILAYAFSISVKTLAVPFGVVYLPYLWVYRFGFRRRFWFSLPLTGLLSLGVFHSYLLLPGVARTYVERIFYQSSIVKGGWVPEAESGLALFDRFSIFSADYIHVAALGILLCLSSVFLPVLWRRQSQDRTLRDVTGLMAAILMGGYGLFCMLVARTPANYGIFLLYVVPIMLGLLWKMAPQAGKWLLLVLFLFGMAIPVSRGIQRLQHPEGGERERQTVAEIRKIETFVKSYAGTFRRIGVSHDFGIPDLRGEEVNFVRLWNFETEDLPQYKLVILSKKDSFADLYLGTNHPDNPTALAYRALCEGNPIPSKFGEVHYSLIHEEGGMEVFERSAVENGDAVSRDGQAVEPSASTLDREQK